MNVLHRIRQRLRSSPRLRSFYWSLRLWLGRTPQVVPEIAWRLDRHYRRQHETAPRIFHFPWGDFEYARLRDLLGQFDEIWVRRQYAFTSDVSPPVIVDGGGNIGTSAIWFLQNYPGCRLTVYEPDPALHAMLRANLARAGFTDADARAEAVWVEDKVVSFDRAGNDSGQIAADGSFRCPAIDLACCLPERVDLLKLDIEGAEFAVIERLCLTGAIGRVRRLVCEYHVRRDDTDRFLRSCQLLRAHGLQLTMSAIPGPWLGRARAAAPFEIVGESQMLVEVWAWRET